MISLSSSSSSSSPSPSQLTFPQRLPYTSNALSAAHTFISIVHTNPVCITISNPVHAPRSNTAAMVSPMWAASLSAQVQYDRASLMLLTLPISCPDSSKVAGESTEPCSALPQTHEKCRGTNHPRTKSRQFRDTSHKVPGPELPTCIPSGLGSPSLQASLPWLPTSAPLNYSHVLLCLWPLLSEGSQLGWLVTGQP